MRPELLLFPSYFVLLVISLSRIVGTNRQGQLTNSIILSTEDGAANNVLILITVFVVSQVTFNNA